MTREIKSLLEERYPFLWVTGEVSNYVTPASGHSYFSLKDNNAVISCVMFKTQKRHLHFSIENGMMVKGMARLSLYAPRGSYQLIFEHMQPDGAGSLQQAFETLKQDLAARGWFDQGHKKMLPFLPTRINVVTSATGAAVRDIINVASRRCPSVPIEIVPVKVQGEGAAQEIVQAIEQVNAHQRSDLIILARGGGSIEDLWSFNTETVARAVFESNIPVITGVGHEIDFTIVDFVADLRAPTPSAAAEMALPDQSDLLRQIHRHTELLNQSIEDRLQLGYGQIRDLASRLKSPARIMDDLRLRIDDLDQRLQRAASDRIVRKGDQLQWLTRTLNNVSPLAQIRERRQYLNGLVSHLDQTMCNRLDGIRSGIEGMTDRLEASNPNSILQRGYSITRALPKKQVITNANDVMPNDRVEIILANGRLVTQVQKTQ